MNNDIKLNQTHSMSVVAAIMFATGKAETIKQAVHMAAQIDESVQARVIKDAPAWVKSAKNVLDSQEPNSVDDGDKTEEE